jgi:hypothetical protein
MTELAVKKVHDREEIDIEPGRFGNEGNFESM